MQIVIDAPVDKVFECLAEPARWPELGWAEEVRMTSDRSVRVGTTFEQKVTVSGGYGKTTGWAKYEVTEFVPNRRLAWEGDIGGLRYLNFIEVEADPAGTRIRTGYEYLEAPVSALPLKLLGTLVVALMAPVTWLVYRIWGERSFRRRLEERLRSMRGGAS